MFPDSNIDSLVLVKGVLISPPHNLVGLRWTLADSTGLSGQPNPLLNHSKQPDCSLVESGGVQSSWPVHWTPLEFQSGGVQWTLLDSTGLTITFRTAATVTIITPPSSHTFLVFTPPPTLPATPTPCHKHADTMEHGVSSA